MPTNLKVIKSPIQKALVEKLEAALERARAGRATGFVLVALLSDDQYVISSCFDRRLELLGALVEAQADVLKE